MSEFLFLFWLKAGGWGFSWGRGTAVVCLVVAAEEMRFHVAHLVGQGATQLPTHRRAVWGSCTHTLSSGFLSISLSEVHELGVLTTAAALCSSKLSIFFENAMQWSCWGMFSYLAWLILLCASCMPLYIQIHLCVCVELRVQACRVQVVFWVSLPTKSSMTDMSLDNLRGIIDLVVSLC